MATNAKMVSAGLTPKRGRPKSGDPFRDEEVEAIVEMQTQRRWTPDEFHQHLDRVYRISRDHFNKILQRKKGGRRGVDPRIRTAFAKVFDWPEARSADFPLGCIQEFLSKLPVSPEHFVGRTDELAFLSEAWNSKKVQVLALIAQGGAGKTSLVNEWLKALRRNHWQGARRVYAWSFYSQGATLNRQANADAFLNHALEWFGENGVSRKSSSEKGVRLAHILQRERILLVLDGIEPLQHPPGDFDGCIRDPGLKSLLRELSRGNHPGMCVVTTRWKIGDLAERFGERVEIRDLDNLQIKDGATLLWELGAKKWGDHELAAASQELRGVAKEFKGHALALTLLARFLAVLHGGDIRKRTLVPRLEDLPELPGGQASRIMHSYEQLLRGKPELAILRLLGLFDRPADADALRSLTRRPRIKGVTDGMAEFNGTQWKFAVESLRAFRLLDPQSPELPETLDCHPLVREHFGHKLKQENEPGWRKCHFRLFEHFGHWKGKSPPETWEQIEALYRAIEHGCKAGMHQKAFDQIYEPFVVQQDEKGNDRYFALKVLGAFAADLTAISGFFSGPDPWRRPVDSLNSKTKGIVLGIAGWELRAVGRLREAKEATHAVLERLKHRKKLSAFDLVECAINASNLSELCLLLGEVQNSVSFARECVAFADKSGDARQKIVKRARLADSLHQAGELDEAQKVFVEAEGLFRQFKPEQKFLNSWPGFWFCDLLLTLGNADEVLKRVGKTMKVAKQREALSDIGLDCLSRGLAKLRKSGAQLPVVKRDLDKAVASLRDAGIQEFVVRSLLAFAEFHRLKRKFADAWDNLEQMKEIAERGEMKLFMTDYHLEAARLSLAERKRQDAEVHFTEARRLVAGSGYARRASEVSDLAKRLGKVV